MTPALTLLALLLLPQQARDVVPHRPAGATLAGIVVTDDADARPVRHARVSISAADAGSGRTAIAGDDGRFEMTGLPAGAYVVTATRPGWVPMQYGAKRPQRPGTPVRLGSGERASITVRLPRGAVITGTVTEQDGRPAPNVSVQVMRWSFERGERRLVSAGTGLPTDDRGLYRIYGLAAGDYIVGAWYGTEGRAAIGELQLTTDLDVRYASSDPRADAPAPAPRTVDFAPVYFPGTASPLEAAVVSVRAGEERGGVDMTLQLVQTARVEGTVTMPDPVPGVAAGVTLMATAQGSSFRGVPTLAYRTITAQPDGSFQFTNVAPGPYTVIARTRGSGALSAVTSVMVAGDEVSGINLTLGRGASISGHVQFDSDGGTPAPDPRNVTVTLQPVPGQPAITVSPADTLARADGSFTLIGATPGEYRLTASVAGGTTTAWVVKTATIDGRDAIDTPVIIGPNGSTGSAAIVLTDRMAVLGGTLQDTAGRAAPEYTIVLFPDDRTRWVPQSRRIRATRPAADGSYNFRNVPGGNYLLAAVDDAEPGAWYDAAWLQALVPAAMKVTIREGQAMTQNLRLGGGE